MNDKYRHLLSRVTVNGVLFRNRMIAAPTSCTVDIGDCTRSPDIKQIMFLEDKARGGAAAVVTNEVSICLQGSKKNNHGCVAVMPEGYDGQMNFVKQAAAIARHGAVPAIELQHAGYFVYRDPANGCEPIGPDAMTLPSGERTRAMTEEDMDRTVEQYRQAAAKMKDAGFRLFVVHTGHGWLLAQFLSPALNHRTDEYGGSLENRARFPLRVLKAVKEAVGRDAVVQCRISGDEHMENGLTIDDVIGFARLAKPYIDIIEISAGAGSFNNVNTFPGIFLPHEVNLPLARAVKRAVPDLLVATVGTYRDPDAMERILRDGDADFICMGRQMMADPDTPHKIMTGKTDDIVPCTRCLNCIGRFFSGVKGCDVNPRAGMNLYDLNLPETPPEKRRVVIVGGGPGGLSAAIEAKARGHEVILLEKTGKLGGTLNYLEADHYKKDLIAFRDYLIRTAERRGVEFRLNTEATVPLLDSLAPDVVLCAVGADPVIPPIEGLKEHAYTMRQLYEQGVTPRGRIVLIGGGLSGCEVGIGYAAEGNDVTVIEMLPEVAAQANRLHKGGIRYILGELKDRLTCMTNTKCVRVNAGSVEVETPDGPAVIPADFIINTLGQKPNRAAADELSACAAPVFEAFGDCVELGQVRGAVHGGYYRARDIR